MRSWGRWRAVMAAAWISVLALGSLATGVQAASFQLTFQAFASPCISGVSNRHDIGVELLSSHGTVLETLDSVDFVAGDQFRACFARHVPLPGRVLLATSLTSPRQVRFRVPRLTLSVDRATDQVTGRSTPDHALTLHVSRCPLSQWYDCPVVLTRHLATNAGGSYGRDLTAIFDLRGHDLVSVTWTSAAGNTWTTVQDVPYMYLHIGTGGVIGAIQDTQRATFRLKRRPGGTVLSTRTVNREVYLQSYEFTFGATLRSGRQVVSDLAGDARVTIPDTTTTIGLAGADQVIHTRCLPLRRIGIFWTGAHGVVVTSTDSHGRASVNLSSIEGLGFRLPPSSSVQILCSTRAGDYIYRSVTVPS